MAGAGPDGGWDDGPGGTPDGLGPIAETGPVEGEGEGPDPGGGLGGAMGVAERELLAIVSDDTNAVADEGDVCDTPPPPPPDTPPIPMLIPIPGEPDAIEPGGEEEGWG